MQHPPVSHIQSYVILSGRPGIPVLDRMPVIKTNRISDHWCDSLKTTSTKSPTIYMQAPLNTKYMISWSFHPSSTSHQFWVIPSECGACWRMLQFCYQTVFTHTHAAWNGTAVPLASIALKRTHRPNRHRRIEPNVLEGFPGLGLHVWVDFGRRLGSFGTCHSSGSQVTTSWDGRRLSARAFASLYRASHPQMHLQPDERIALTKPMRVITQSRDGSSAQYDLKILQLTAFTAQVRLTSVSEPNHINTSKPWHQADPQMLI